MQPVHLIASELDQLADLRRLARAQPIDRGRGDSLHRCWLPALHAYVLFGIEGDVAPPRHVLAVACYSRTDMPALLATILDLWFYVPVGRALAAYRQRDGYPVVGAVQWIMEPL